MRPVRTSTTLFGGMSVPCFSAVSWRSCGVIPYPSGRQSTPFIPATSSSTAREMIGGYLSRPPLFQMRLPRSLSAVHPFQNIPWWPRWLSVSTCVPQWV